jgi:hypothetical protein
MPTWNRSAECAPAINAKEVGRRILENDAPVKLMLDSAKTMRPAMTVNEPTAWLDHFGEENIPLDDSRTQSMCCGVMRPRQ